VAQTPEWHAAKSSWAVDGVSSAAVGLGEGSKDDLHGWKPCPVGKEHHCAGRIFRPPANKALPLVKLAESFGFSKADGAPLGSLLLQDQARRHTREGCLYLNEGCFAQTVGLYSG
jgi:hypothetical protein